MSSTSPGPLISVDEYFEMLSLPDSEKRHWKDGVVFGMSGGSPEHNTIKSNLHGLAFMLLQDKPCRPFDSDTLVNSKQHNLFAYPDLSIVCGPAEWEKWRGVGFIQNPIVIFEVLSASTQLEDRTLKVEAYRTIPSVETIVLVESEKVFVSVLQRKEALWEMTGLREISDTLNLDSVGISIPMEEIYRDVRFGTAS